MLDELADDESHPIPSVNVIDYVRTIKEGGAGYLLVIAKPIRADRRSMHRLIKKIEVYVTDFFSEESKQKQGTPAPGRMWIAVHIHKDSSPEAFELIEKHAPWIASFGTKVVVNAIDENGAVVREISRTGF